MKVKEEIAVSRFSIRNSTIFAFSYTQREHTTTRWDEMEWSFMNVSHHNLCSEMQNANVSDKIKYEKFCTRNFIRNESNHRHVTLELLWHCREIIKTKRRCVLSSSMVKKKSVWKGRIRVSSDEWRKIIK